MTHSLMDLMRRLLILLLLLILLAVPAMTRIALAAEASATPALEPPASAELSVPQGPALDTPREMLELINQRQRFLTQREEAIRIAEARLATLRGDIEQMLGRYEQAVKTVQAKQDAEKRKQTQTDEAADRAKLAQVGKMYEGMAPEEAAARLEKMPTAMALQVLRSVKGKTAGAILAFVTPEKAVKLTSQFMAGKPSSKKH